MFTGFNTSVRLICVTYYLSNPIRFRCVDSSHNLRILVLDTFFFYCTMLKSFCAHHEGLGVGGISPLILCLRIFGVELSYARSGRFRGEISLLRPPRIDPRFVSCPARILVAVPSTLSRLADNYYYVLKPGQRQFLLDSPRTAPVWKGFVPWTATFFKVWSR